jgi:transcription initiation factor IIE alpha subunit
MTPDTNEWTKLVQDFLKHGNINKLYICPDCQQTHLKINEDLEHKEIIFNCPSCEIKCTLAERQED